MEIPFFRVLSFHFWKFNFPLFSDSLSSTHTQRIWSKSSTIHSENVDLTKKRGAARPAKAKAALIKQKPILNIEPLKPIEPKLVEPWVEQEPESIETESVTTNKKTTRKRKIQTEPKTNCLRKLS